LLKLFTHSLQSQTLHSSQSTRSNHIAINNKISITYANNMMHDYLMKPKGYQYSLLVIKIDMMHGKIF
jgi:hypothetical protein